MPRHRGSTLPPDRSRRSQHADAVKAGSGRTERSAPMMGQDQYAEHVHELIARRDAEQRQAMIFINWLDAALAQNGIPDDKTLAHAAGIAKSTVGHWRALECVPSFDVCRSLARVLHVPLLTIALKAGHIIEADLRIVEQDQTGASEIVAPQLGEEHTLTIPADTAHARDDAALARAIHAIQSVPSLPNESIWQVVGFLRGLHTAAEISERLRTIERRHPDHSQYAPQDE